VQWAIGKAFQIFILPRFVSRFRRDNKEASYSVGLSSRSENGEGNARFAGARNAEVRAVS
jgi:hypothetical protein